jgi:hypothetical protein
MLRSLKHYGWMQSQKLYQICLTTLLSPYCYNTMGYQLNNITLLENCDNMTNQRIKFIASPNLSSLERDVNNWLKEELKINIRQMSLYTDIGDDYEMALMIWYDIADVYTEKKKQQKTSKNDATEKGLEKLAKISSARV